jgi:FlgN protein
MKRVIRQKPAKGGTRVRDLVRLLDQMASLYGQMFTFIDEKLAAMRRSDDVAMTSASGKEQLLADRLAEREGLRKQLMDAVGEEIGLASKSGRRLTVSQLANRLTGADKAALLASADRLRQQVAKVSQANRVAGVVAREVVNHLRWIFAAVRPGDEKPTGYSKSGVVMSQSAGPMFDAVG